MTGYSPWGRKESDSTEATARVHWVLARMSDDIALKLVLLESDGTDLIDS